MRLQAAYMKSVKQRWTVFGDVKVAVRRSTSQTQPQKQEDPYLLLDIKLLLCFPFRFSRQHRACVWLLFPIINICEALLHLNWMNWQIHSYHDINDMGISKHPLSASAMLSGRIISH